MCAQSKVPTIGRKALIRPAKRLRLPAAAAPIAGDTQDARRSLRPTPEPGNTVNARPSVPRHDRA